MSVATSYNRPLRIALVAPYDLARRGGVATHIRAQARALRALGHVVHVYGPASAPLPDGEQTLGRSVPLLVGGTRSGAGLDPRSIAQVRRAMASHRFDVVHIHEPLMPLVPWAATWFASAPVVATFHVHREAGHPFYPIARPLLSRILARVARRLAVSAAARRTIAAHFPGRYEIVPNGIDVEAFRRPAPRPASFSEGVRHVLYVGRLEPRKGVDRLVAAMSRVQRRLANARLVVVGSGPDRESLRQLAAARTTDILFMGDVPDPELPALYQWSELACAPAIGDESFGIVLLESLAAGTPVVATRIEGYDELIGRAQCGRLVPPGDADALADAIEGLLGDGAARREAAARGAALALRYDWRLIAKRLEAIYEETLDSTRDPARSETTSRPPIPATGALRADPAAHDPRPQRACE
jgi:phosphatidylinositol alpha-mannosyltransferase